jgi:hypothetical protein
MNQSAFFPRLAAYCLGLPVLLVIYLFSRGIVSMPAMLPLFAVALLAGIWGQARIRRSYPQDFSQRVEWIACAVFLVLVLTAGLFMVKW